MSTECVLFVMLRMELGHFATKGGGGGGRGKAAGREKRIVKGKKGRKNKGLTRYTFYKFVYRGNR